MLVEQPEIVKPVGQPGQAEQPPNGPVPQRSGAVMRTLWIVLLLAAAVIAFVVYSGITTRAKASIALEKQTSDDAVPTVAVAKPEVTGNAEEIVLPGNMQAYIDTPIWARASGYLKAWHADIGARVKKGQLLAEIEAPEVDQQLQQAKANLTVADANLKLSQITSERYGNLFKTDSVAKQDVDNAVQDAAAKQANVTADRANVARLQQMVQYERVYAPFDGIITARNVDVGALVDAGSNTQGKELFHLAAHQTLRTYVNVPEVYSRAAGPGVTAYVTLTEFPGQQFAGKVVRNAGSIDVSSRTLLVEVDVKNPAGKLLPGSYVSVHLKLPSKVEAVTVPSSALIFRSQGLQIAKARDGRVELSKIILGHDFGDKVEILSGLDKNDSVIVNPSDSIAQGQKVRVSTSQAE